MTVQVYKSTDASAPALYGSNGRLQTLLDSCLVSGYGAKPAAGWTRPFYDAATHTAAFKPAGTPEGYLQVIDNSPGGAGAREARIRGYETMSAYNVGTGPYPTTAQLLAGIDVRKSTTADGTARLWVLVADERRFHLFIETNDTASCNSYICFGAMKSYKPADNWPFFIAGRPLENQASLATSNEFAAIRNRTIGTVTGGYLVRSYTGVGSSAAIGFLGDPGRGLNLDGAHGGSTGLAYPNPADGGLYLSRTYINELNVPRGEAPGIWVPNHNRPVSNRDTFSGTEGLVGRDFLALWTGVGCLAVETSDTWDV